MATNLQCRKTYDQLEFDDKITSPSNGHGCEVKREYQGTGLWYIYCISVGLTLDFILYMACFNPRNIARIAEQPSLTVYLRASMQVLWLNSRSHGWAYKSHGTFRKFLYWSDSASLNARNKIYHFTFSILLQFFLIRRKK